MNPKIHRRISLLIALGLFLFASDWVATQQTDTKWQITQLTKLYEMSGPYNSCQPQPDLLAVALQQSPELDAYLLSYGPTGDRSGTANRILRWIKNYLVANRGVDVKLLHLTNCGNYKNTTNIFTEFWVAPRGAATPQCEKYENGVATADGNFAEYEGYTNLNFEGGFYEGSVELASFAEALRLQPNKVAYIVARNRKESTVGAWRRTARLEAQALIGYGIASNRVKILFGGVSADESESQDTEIELWILSPDDSPPVTKRLREKRPRQEQMLGEFSKFDFQDAESKKWIEEGFIETLKADPKIDVCFVLRLRPTPEKLDEDDDFKPVDFKRLVANWRAKLIKTHGVKSTRIHIIQVVETGEYETDKVEIWFVPPNAALPNPYQNQTLFEITALHI